MPKTVGIVPGSFKPYHAGHDALVRLASKENDVVHLLVSTSSRGTADGSTMTRIWHEYILSTLPSNVIACLAAGSPVKKTFDILEIAEQVGCDEVFRIYSDSKDIFKYTPEKLRKVAPKLYADPGRISLRGVSRTETINVSGTMMRRFVEANDHARFIEHLPALLRPRGKEVFDLLKGHQAFRMNCTI